MIKKLIIINLILAAMVYLFIKSNIYVTEKYVDQQTSKTENICGVKE